MGYVVSGWETAEDIKEAGGVEGIEGAIDRAPCADAMVNPVMLTSAAWEISRLVPVSRLPDSAEVERSGSVLELGL